jgi:hypothetical protein
MAQEVISASADTTIDLGASVIAADEDVVLDNQLGLVMLENLGALPDASDVIALGHDVNGDRFISFDTTTALSGGVVARPGDVVRYDGAAYSIEFDASAAGVPTGVLTDATSLAPGGLLLSFDTTVDLGGGLVAADEDLVRWNGSSFSLAFDGSTEGLDLSLDIDAAQELGGGSFLLSFDTTGQIAGLVFDDEDVVRFDGADWSIEFDASEASSTWAAADLDAVMVPEPSVGLMLLIGATGLFWFCTAWKEILMRLVIILLWSLLLATPALAVDGVLEINQTCAVETGCFAGDAAGFPVTITSPGSYRLTGNLDADATGIEILADFVALDLNGFRLDGDATSSSTSHGVHIPTRRAVEIRNGSISRFAGRAVNADGGGQHRVLGVRVLDSGSDGIYLNGDEMVVRGCIVKSSVGRGIHTGARSIVEGNVSESNGSTGIRVSSFSLVKDNVVSGGATSGIFALGNGTIVGNTVTNNGGHGMNIAGDSLIRDNTVTSNTLWGIHGAKGVLVVGNLVNENNVADSSTEGGINVRGPSVVRDNIVRLNNQVGIFAETDPINGTRGSVIEGNLASDTLHCFDFEGTQNFYAGNRAYNCEINYRNVAGQIDGGGNLGN